MTTRVELTGMYLLRDPNGCGREGPAIQPLGPTINSTLANPNRCGGFALATPSPVQPG